MLNILSILKHIHNGIVHHDPRYIVTGDEHIHDSKSGVFLHVYDNWFKITYDDDNVVTQDDFTTEEQGVVWEIKKLITPPEVLKERAENYKPLQIERRKKLSELYQNPTPVGPAAPIAEKDTTEYTG